MILKHSTGKKLWNLARSVKKLADILMASKNGDRKTI